MVKWPFQWLRELEIGDEQVILKIQVQFYYFSEMSLLRCNTGRDFSQGCMQNCSFQIPIVCQEILHDRGGVIIWKNDAFEWYCLMEELRQSPVDMVNIPNIPLFAGLLYIHLGNLQRPQPRSPQMVV